MTTRKSTRKEPEANAVVDDQKGIVDEAEAKADDQKASGSEEAETAPVAQKSDEDDDGVIAGEPYYVEVVSDATNVQKVNLRDGASAEDDSNIDHAVAVGSKLKAVADLGEWTMLTHGLYVMSKYVKKL